MLCFCAYEERTRKHQVTTDPAAPDAALWRTFSTTLSETDIVVVRAGSLNDASRPLVVNVGSAPEAAAHPGSLFLRSDNKRQKATRALHRMAFARLSP